MDTEVDQLEPAIPQHLRRERTRPLGSPKDFKPKHASYSARFDESVTSLPMIYVGLQFPPWTEAGLAIRTIASSIAAPFGPESHDRARFIDEEGFTNLVFALYWRDTQRYERWSKSMRDGWWHHGLSLDGHIGAFAESFTPSVADTETTFSHPYPEGYSILADKMSGKTDTHEYWGSARDRIPRAQTEDLSPAGMLSLGPGRRPGDSMGHRLVVQPQDNLCLLRSGQDWSETVEEERAFYLDEVKPPLETGMREISRVGLTLGCFFNRYMQIEGKDGPTEKTYSLSAWHSLAELEAWVKTETHLKIFGAGIRHYKQAGDTAKLRLYHEMMVVRAEDQSFTYFNCHRHTGMLRILWSSEW